MLTKLLTVLVMFSQRGVYGLVLEVEASTGGWNQTGHQNCTQFMQTIKTMILTASSEFYSATSSGVQYPDYEVVLPPEWAGCNTTEGPVPSSRSVDVWITRRNSRAVQPGGCGDMGSRVDINHLLLQDTQIVGRTLMLLTTKHMYGVFDEFGEYNNSRFPAVYKKGPDMKHLQPTSCTNSNIRGNFSECDVSSDCLERVQENQTHIFSSLFYNRNKTLFPQMSQFCNSSNHQPLAPTPHNLICRGRSVMDVIQDIAGVHNSTIPQPEVKFLQRRKVKQFILFVDRGPAMAANGQRFWNIFRTGWEQFINRVQDTTRISVRFQENGDYNITNITWPDKDQGGYWEHQIFPSSIQGISSQNLSAFDVIRNYTQLMENLDYPEIIVVSGSDSTAADGEAEREVVNWINQNKIAVHVFTFSSVKNSALLQLTQHGTLYSVPVGSPESVCFYFASSVFRQISNAIHDREFQDKVFQLQNQDLPVINKNFYIANNQLDGNLLFLSGQQLGQNIKIEIQSPEGIVHSITSGDILPVFSPGFIYKLNTDLSAGNWTLINLSLGAGTSLGSESVFMVHQFNGSPKVRETRVGGGGNTPFNWTQSTPVIPVYVELQGSDQELQGSDQELQGYDQELQGSDPTPDFHCSVLVPGEGGCHSLTLHDDGLLAPDTAEKDGIYSGYLYEIPVAGYYSIITSSPSPSSDQLQSSFVSISPGFFVSSARPAEIPDLIPPARITDLVIAEEDNDQDRVVLQFTEPGNDYFDHGDVENYFFYCGSSSDLLSYRSCDSVRGTIKFGTDPRARKNITLPVVTKDRLVYIGVVAQDLAGNRGEMSNVVSFFMEGPTTSTSSTSSTESTTPVTPGTGTFVTYAELWGVTGTLSGLLLLVLLAILIYFLLRRRRKKSEEYRQYAQKQLAMQTKKQVTVSKLEHNLPPPPVGSHYVTGSEGLHSHRRDFQRTLTMTNGSLSNSKEAFYQEEESEEDDDQEESSEYEHYEEGDDNPAYTSSPDSSFQAYQVNPQLQLRVQNQRANSRKTSSNQQPHLYSNNTISHISNDSRLNEVGIPQTYAALTRETLRRSQMQHGSHRSQRNKNLEKGSQPTQYTETDRLSKTTGPPGDTVNPKKGPPTAPKPAARNLPRQDCSSEVDHHIDQSKDTGFSSKEAGRPGEVQQKPFNYIAFSQMLYGEAEEEEASSKARAVSFV